MDDRIQIPDGSWLGYRQSGHGSTDLLMLHGFAANMETWHDLAPFFPEETYTLHMIDLPPHGTASRGRHHDYSIPAQAERVASFIDIMSLKQVTVIGHSMGGAIALALAIHLQELGMDRISKLVLIDAPAYPQPLPGFIKSIALPFIGPLALWLLSPEHIARNGLRAVLWNSDLVTRERINRYASTFRVPGTALALSHCARELTPPNAERLTSFYRHLDIPALIIWGQQDNIIRQTHGERLSQDIPAATFVSLLECGHNPHEELPGKTFELIEHFLSNNSFDRHSRAS